MGHPDRRRWEQVKMLYNSIACLMYNLSKLGAFCELRFQNVRVGRMPQNCNVKDYF